MKALLKIIGRYRASTERADNESGTRDFETKILNLRRRIEEQRKQLDEYSQTRSELTRHNEQIPQETPIVDQAREEKEIELLALKAKLMGKKL